MADVDRVILPGITHWNHPSFFAYFSITGSRPGILAELLTAALNVNAMLWQTSPAATELESAPSAGCASCSGCPTGFRHHQRHRLDSTLLALAAAREAPGWRSATRAWPATRLPPLRMYGSEQAHSSIEKAVHRPRHRPGGVRRSRPTTELPHGADRAGGGHRARTARRGCAPLRVVATVGTTSTTSDRSRARDRRDLRAREGSGCTSTPPTAARPRWCPRCAGLLAGVELADSLVVNPHKWLFTPIDCSVLYTRDPEVLRAGLLAGAGVPDHGRERRRST